jgi:teichuronic acid biosynthesis glycosyltransferase TuaC
MAAWPPAPEAAAASPARLRLVLFSTLYPSSVRPGHGAFVETRLQQLLHTGAVDARVVAPVPWFPSTHPRFGPWARMAATPRAERHNGLDVQHPRYLLPPAVGETVAPLVLALGALPALRRLLREGFDFDLIDAHYYYPDGVAAALLGRWLGKPVVISARGSDLNVLGGHALPRRMMAWAGRQAAASIGVCQVLVDTLRGWGVPAQRLHVMRNGVDLARFRPLDVAAARQALGITGGPVLLCVANLVEVKGHALVLDALHRLRDRHPRAHLLLVGDGPLRKTLERQAAVLGLCDRVRFVGAVPNDALATWYSAADLSVLASRSEGWANVLLESMACGTPVVATDVGGSSEVVAVPAAGALVRRRDADALAETLAGVLAARPPRDAVRRYAEGFGWEATSQAQWRLFNRIALAHGRPDDRPLATPASGNG